MISLKYVALLLVIGSVFSQTPGAPAAANGTTTANPLNMMGLNTCGTVGGLQPVNMTQCSLDTSASGYSCCYLVFRNNTSGLSYTKCDSVPTYTLVGDYKSTVKSIIEGQKLGFVDYQCPGSSSSYITVSFLFVLVAALLF